MLDKDSAFQGDFSRQDNSIPLLENNYDFQPPFVREESGAFSAPKLDFADIKQYQTAEEYNYSDFLDLFDGNHSIIDRNRGDLPEFVGDNFSDIIGTVKESGDRDPLLNSDRPFANFPKDFSPENLPFGEEDFPPGERLAGGDKVPPIPAILKNSDLNLEDLPFGKEDFEPGERLVNSRKMPLIPPILKDSDLNLEDLPFGKEDFEPGERLVNSRKIPPIPAILKDSDFTSENLPFEII